MQKVYQLEKTTPQQKTPRPHTQHTQAYIKLHTSIYISIPTSNTYKLTYNTKQTHTPKHTLKPKQTPHPKQHPKNNTAKKSITLYNSKYCIRVVLRRKIYVFFVVLFPHFALSPACQVGVKNRSSAPLLLATAGIYFIYS